MEFLAFWLRIMRCWAIRAFRQRATLALRQICRLRPRRGNPACRFVAETGGPLVGDRRTGTREDPSLRREPGALYAFPQQTLYSVGIASVGLGIARGMLDAFVELALRKTPRGTGRLADNAVIQAEMARAEARLGAARCYLIETVSEIYRRRVRRHRSTSWTARGRGSPARTRSPMPSPLPTTPTKRPGS